MLSSPTGWPARISGAGAESGVHRIPGISPSVNSRSVTPSSRRRSEVKRMSCLSEVLTALPRDDLWPDRDSGEEYPCRYVHGYHLPVLRLLLASSHAGLARLSTVAV